MSRLDSGSGSSLKLRWGQEGARVVIVEDEGINYALF